MHKATHSPIVCIPVAPGFGPGDDLRIHTNIRLCERHVNELNVTMLLTPIAKQQMMVAAAGRVVPDFKRAFLRKCAVDSPEFAQYLQTIGTAH